MSASTASAIHRASAAPDDDRPAVDFALYFAAQGFRVLPIPPRQKGPTLKDWPNKATTDPAQITQWFNEQPEGNYGILTTGLIAVDIDPRNGGHLWLDENEDKLSDTLRFKTGSGGWHILYRAPEGHNIGNRVDIAQGVDIRGNGGQIVGPGSIHPQGGQYMIEAGPDDVDLALAPPWLIDLIDQPQINGHDSEAVSLSAGPILERKRNVTLTRICGHLAKAFPEPKVREELHQINKERCKPPLPPGDVDRIATSICQREAKQSRDTAVPLNPVLWADLSQEPKREALIKGVSDRGTLSEIHGESGAAKTFVALDLGLHVSLGWPWHGHKVRQGAVVYIATEGGGGIERRLDALRLHHDIVPDGVPFYVLNRTVDLCHQDGDTYALIEAVQQIEGVELVVVDTVSRALVGGNENASDDMGAFVANCDMLRLETGAHVLLVHHVGKDALSALP